MGRNRRAVVCSSLVTSRWDSIYARWRGLLIAISSLMSLSSGDVQQCAVTPELQDKRWRKQSLLGCRFSIVCATPKTRPSISRPQKVFQSVRTLPCQQEAAGSSPVVSADLTPQYDCYRNGRVESCDGLFEFSKPLPRLPAIEACRPQERSMHDPSA